MSDSAGQTITAPTTPMVMRCRAPPVVGGVTSTWAYSYDAPVALQYSVGTLKMNIRVETPAILSIPESFVPFIEQWRSTPEEERLQFSPKSLQVKRGRLGQPSHSGARGSRTGCRTPRYRTKRLPS